MIQWILSFFCREPEPKPEHELAFVELCDGEVIHTPIKRFKNGEAIAIVYNKWRMVGVSFVKRIIEENGKADDK